ncbi:MAG: GntR family transcriptional regulator [Acidimicrobiales bacterium]
MKPPVRAETGLFRATLDSSDPLPLWAQLARELRRRLSSGDFDERFPTELELSGNFGVSRATVREAIRHLRSEGLLDARRGSGTFVVHRQLDAPILGTSGLAQAIIAAGLVETSKVLRLEEAPAGETAARALGIASHETVQWVERLRYADGEPLALDLSALALDASQRHVFVTGDLSQGSLYGLLETLFGLRVTGGSERLRAVTCAAAERKLLRPGRKEGVFEVERVAYATDRAVEWRRSLVRGRGYELGATWGIVPANRR